MEREVEKVWPLWGRMAGCSAKLTRVRQSPPYQHSYFNPNWRILGMSSRRVSIKTTIKYSARYAYF